MAFSAAFVAIPASAEPGGYVGVGAGEAKTDSHNTSYKIFGGIQATQNFGLELAYNDFRGYHNEKSDSWSLAGTARYRWISIGISSVNWALPEIT